MNTTKYLSLTDDGWNVTLFCAEPRDERSPLSSGDTAEALDIINKLDRLEQNLEMAFFDFERFRVAVEAAPVQANV